MINYISKYKSIYDENKTNKIKLYKIKSYINRSVDEVKKDLSENKLQPIIIGDGDKIINQYPLKNTEVVNNDKIFLITNSKKYIINKITLQILS